MHTPQLFHGFRGPARAVKDKRYRSQMQWQTCLDAQGRRVLFWV